MWLYWKDVLNGDVSLCPLNNLKCPSFPLFLSETQTPSDVSPAQLDSKAF